MEAIAKLNNVPTPPRKMRSVVNMVRGKRVSEALNILKFDSKIGSDKVEKLLLSAVANWQEKYGEEELENADLYVKTIQVDSGPILKRLRPAPQGRAHRIRKRSNHVTIVIDNYNQDQASTEEETEQEEQAESEN